MKFGTEEDFPEADTHPKVTRSLLTKRANPTNVTASEIKEILSRLYLIRTPYGYVLGTHNIMATTEGPSTRIDLTSEINADESSGKYYIPTENKSCIIFK